MMQCARLQLPRTVLIGCDVFTARRPVQTENMTNILHYNIETMRDRIDQYEMAYRL